MTLTWLDLRISKQPRPATLGLAQNTGLLRLLWLLLLLLSGLTEAAEETATLLLLLLGLLLRRLSKATKETATLLLLLGLLLRRLS